MTTPTNFEIVNAMARYGGSFVQALAAAFERADPDNFARLRAAFPEYWDEYAGVATIRAHRLRDEARATAEEETRGR
jgi:hypothetical protein